MGFVLHSLSETGHDWCGRPQVGTFQSRSNRQQALRLLRSNWRNLILRLGRLSLIGELISGYKPICYMSAENSSKIVILVKEQAEAEMKQELDASVADASQHLRARSTQLLPRRRCPSCLLLLPTLHDIHGHIALPSLYHLRAHSALKHRG